MKLTDEEKAKRREARAEADRARLAKGIEEACARDAALPGWPRMGLTDADLRRLEFLLRPSVRKPETRA